MVGLEEPVEIVEGGVPRRRPSLGAEAGVGA
jgi:hypothetical protein